MQITGIYGLQNVPHLSSAALDTDFGPDSETPNAQGHTGLAAAPYSKVVPFIDHSFTFWLCSTMPGDLRQQTACQAESFWQDR